MGREGDVKLEKEEADVEREELSGMLGKREADEDNSLLTRVSLGEMEELGPLVAVGCFGSDELN